MSDAFDVPGPTRMKNLALPSMAGALIAGIRLSIIAAWGCVVLVEWFGSNEGAGFRSRPYQSAANYNGLMAWGIVVLVVVIVVDRGIIERIDRSVHKWRGVVGDFGARTIVIRRRSRKDEQLAVLKASKVVKEFRPRPRTNRRYERSMGSTSRSAARHS